MKKSTILITGADGYLGWSLSYNLCSNENYDVIGFVRNIYNLKRKPQDKIVLIDSIKMLNEFQVDIVIHCATNYGRENNTLVKDILDSNLIFPISIIENLNKNKKKPFFFINVDTVLKKEVNLYSLTKSHFKEILSSLEKKIPFNFINLRLEHFYGINAPENNFISFLFDKMHKNTFSLDLTKGEQFRDFIYIEDLIKAFELIIKNLSEINEFTKDINIGTGVGVQIKEIANLIKQTLNSSTILNFGAIPYRDNELMTTESDISFITNLGWKPKTSIEEGIIKIKNSL